MNLPMQAIAEQLLDRALNAEDGYAPEAIRAAEKRLGRALPSALAEFYALVGNNAAFAQSFNRFARLENLQMREDGQVVFLEENQFACYWSFDAAERIFQTMEPEGEDVFEVEQDMASFLRGMMYYQLAQGGYAHGAYTDAPDLREVLRMVAELGWTQVVDWPSLKIFAQGPKLLWYLGEVNQADSQLFFSTLHRDDLDIFIKRYHLIDLA